jgi:nucleoporin NDC1
VVQELYNQSLEQPEVRRAVFSLSQPGGHPRNWNTILGACLTHLNSITQVLASIIYLLQGADMYSGPKYPLPFCMKMIVFSLP